MHDNDSSEQSVYQQPIDEPKAAPVRLKATIVVRIRRQTSGQ